MKWKEFLKGGTMKRVIIGLILIGFMAFSAGGAELCGILQNIDHSVRDNAEQSLLKITTVNGETAVGVTVQARDISFFHRHNIPFIRIAGDYVTADIPVSLLDEAAQAEGIERIEPKVRKKMYNDVGIPKINAAVMHAAGYTGDDIIVGIVDSGIDIDHPAFKDSEGNSRILKLWDQNTGTVWTKDQIDAGTCTATDTNGHGTHVAGSFAGFHDVLAYLDRKGSATTANIIFVKTNFYDVNEGVEFIYDEAQILGKPAIVNLSLGSQFGPHDGSDADTAAMDTLIADSAGDLIVVRSAGNDGDMKLHGYLDDISTTATTLDFNVSTYTQTSGTNNDYAVINFYYDSSTPLEVQITDSQNNATGWVGSGGYSGASGDGTYIYVSGDTYDSDTRIIQIVLGDYSGVGAAQTNYIRSGTSWKFEFRTASGSVPRLDGWISEQISQGGGTVYFSGLADSTGMSLGNGACGNNVITVAAYTSRKYWDSKDGNTYNYTTSTQDAITTFSSRGPTRDGRQKPDITGPGSILLSTLSEDVAYVSDPFLPPVGYEYYQYMQGTSMSSPAVAGGVALIKEANPSWDYADIIDYFKENSQGTTVYSWTANVWDVAWGWGVLDLTNACSGMTFAITAPEDESMYIPLDDITFVWEPAGDAGTVTYTVELDETSEFLDPVSQGSTTNLTLTTTAPHPRTCYYRIKAENGMDTVYSSNYLTIYTSNVQTIDTFEEVTAGNTTDDYLPLHLLSQATATGDELVFEWAEPNTPAEFNYYYQIYREGSVPPALTAFSPGYAAGQAKIALANSLNLVESPGMYAFKLTLESKDLLADTRSFEQTFNVRDFKGVLLPNLMNDDFLKIGIVGQGLADIEKNATNLLRVSWDTFSDDGFIPNGRGGFSSSSVFNNRRFTPSVTFIVEALFDSVAYDTGITLSRVTVSPAQNPHALHPAILLEGSEEFTAIRIDYPEMAGLDPVEGFVCYLGSVDSAVPYTSETHKIARWKDGAWREVRVIDESGYYAVLTGSLPPLDFDNGSLKNSPNPFNPSTTIGYTVSEAGHVVLKIYDSRGRMVTTLQNGPVSYAGEFEIEWNGCDERGQELPSGVYYAVLEINGKRFTRKMVILK